MRALGGRLAFLRGGGGPVRLRLSFAVSGSVRRGGGGKEEGFCGVVRARVEGCSVQEEVALERFRVFFRGERR
jgi:hypothetical protein